MNQKHQAKLKAREARQARQARRVINGIFIGLIVLMILFLLCYYFFFGLSVGEDADGLNSQPQQWADTAKWLPLPASKTTLKNGTGNRTQILGDGRL